MRPALPRPTLAPSLLVLAVAGCAAARNYTDPLGPRYEGRHAVTGAADGDIRVVTFNVRFGERVDRAIEVLREAEALRGADVIVLQEMDEGGVEKVASALALSYVYIPSTFHPARRRNFGNAVLSPWPLADVRKIVLPHGSRLKQQRRAAVRATVAVDGARIRVYAVHLETPLGINGAQRRDQAAAIVADARDSPDPVIVAGDFNSRRIGTFLEGQGFSWATRDIPDTVHWFAWDHIFTRGLALRDPQSAGVVRDNREASDHKPAWAVLVPPPAQP